MSRTAILFVVLGAACASAPAPTLSKPQGVSSSSAAATAAMPMTSLDLKAPALAPVKMAPSALSASYDRVALIWGHPYCAARPWVVTVVDLGARAITFRGLASSSELSLYFPSPTGEACYKGPCPTMAVEMGIPPSLTSGTGTMMGGTGKGLYALPSGTSCPEPSMLQDADLIDLATRLVQGRNDAAAAVAARLPAR